MKILVLGGGFAGVEAAIKLRKYGYDVSLISDRDYLFIYPTSIWIPTGKQKFDDSKLSLLKLQKKHGFELLIETVSKLDIENQKIHTNLNMYSYDYLFIGLGMGKVNLKGLEHTHSICGKPAESVVIREKLENLISEGHGNINIGFGGNPKDSTATTVRGGPAFELLFNISHLLKRKGLREKIDLTFFAPMPEPGKKMGKNAFKNLNRFFKKYYVKTKIGTKIKEFRKDTIVFADDSELKSDVTIYISGGDGLELIKNTSLPQNETGFLKIDEHCQVENNKNIFAIGDSAALVNLPWAAKQGHIAEVMADVSTFNFHNSLIGSTKRKSYLDKLHILCIMDTGDGAAIVFRNDKKEIMIPLPVVGHWLKKAWGWYFKQTKLKRMFRIPGM